MIGVAAYIVVVPAKAGTQYSQALLIGRSLSQCSVITGSSAFADDDAEIVAAAWPTLHATTFTIRCGTTITFLGGFPSSARWIASSASTAASISAFLASRATVTSARFLPLTCTGSVIVVSTSK